MDYLFSIHPKHASNIFSGRKTFEIRKRKIQLEYPSRLWIYVTTPSKMLGGVANVDYVDFGSPDEIWERHSSNMCISRRELDDYAGNQRVLSAIHIRSVVEFDSPPRLEELRRVLPRFHPPQFYIDMRTKKSYVEYLNRYLDSSALTVS